MEKIQEWLTLANCDEIQREKKPAHHFKSISILSNDNEECNSRKHYILVEYSCNTIFSTRVRASTEKTSKHSNIICLSEIVRTDTTNL